MPDMSTTTTDQAPDIPASTTGTDRPSSDAQLLRIRRIGKRLFKVAKCVLRFDDPTIAFVEGQNTSPSVESSFCDSFPLSPRLVVVPDMRTEPSMLEHAMVAGAPFLQFYAVAPIFNADRMLIGCISLLDHKPRPFSENDKLALMDLASMIERELSVRSLNAVQLELQQKNKNLRRKSLIDPLIGTWNRGAIMRILAIEAQRCDKIGVPLSVVVMDLDFFKKINDTYGHPAGDEVLVRVTSRLRSCIRQQESLGRYGGEEFIAVLPGSSHEVAYAIAQRMREAVAAEGVSIGDAVVGVTISVGVCSTDMFPTATTDELIGRADKALYRAKDAGRNRVMQAQAD
jgi:diguanylate cyclase (GGDEF)-like protein